MQGGFLMARRLRKNFLVWVPTAILACAALLANNAQIYLIFAIMATVWAATTLAFIELHENNECWLCGEKSALGRWGLCDQCQWANQKRS